MPTLHQVKLPPPTDWQELQRMTCDLYKQLWSNEDIQQFGSIGQRQNGVDIFGFVGQKKDLGGIQCKCVASLTPKEVEEEYKQSLRFTPKLSKYLIVTTSKRDAKVQKKSIELRKRVVTDAQLFSGKISVNDLRNTGMCFESTTRILFFTSLMVIHPVS
jgi:hypothetical protein